MLEIIILSVLLSIIFTMKVEMDLNAILIASVVSQEHVLMDVAMDMIHNI